jgi:hypothetical protein
MRSIVLLAVLVAMTASLAGPALARPYEDAVDKAGYRLTGAIARKGLSTGKSVGIAKFRDRIGVACEPLASLLTNKMRANLISHMKEMGFAAKVVESVDPTSVDAVVSGVWTGGAGEKVSLAVKLGDVKSAQFTDIGMAHVEFDKSSLPPEARQCILEVEPVEREISMSEALIVRVSPTALGRQLEKLKAGSKIWVSARVITEGGEGWFVVRLPDDGGMPVGMRERRGFAFGLGRHEDIKIKPKVEGLDGALVTVKTTKLRSDPTARSEELDRRAIGEVLTLTGKVEDKNWYRVAWRDEEAFVHGSMVEQLDAGEAESWLKIKGADDRAGLKMFLKDWPNGYFAARATENLKALGPELEVKVWTEDDSYRAGDTIEIFIKGNKDFYGRVVYRDAEGNLIQLLPNEFRKEHHFKAGKTYTIPDEEDQFDLSVTPPFGTENIIVFASTEPLPKVVGNDIGAGLTLLDEKLGQVKRRMRGFSSKGGATGNKGNREFLEATTVLTTKP